MSSKFPLGIGTAAVDEPGRRPVPVGIDGLTVLTVYLVLLCAVPSSLTISALGSAGRPAFLWALAATLWWGWYQLQRRAPTGAGPQYVRRALFVFLALAAVSYAVAMLRGLPGDEISPADNGLLRLIAWAGILLVANDGLNTPGGLRTLLRRIALAGGLLATLGILQSVTDSSLIDWVSIPGMSSSLPEVAGLDARGGFVRASATASHPLEYGVALSVAFPIAIVLAMEDHARSRLVRWFPVAAIAVASALSVSRSALIGILLGVIVVAWTFPARIKVALGVAGIALVIAVGILMPGLLGTTRALFTGLADDPSATSRTSSYGIAGDLLSHFPLLGKGFGTLLPRYHIFDNQYVQLAIELGLVGLAAFLAVLLAAAVSASSARNRASLRIDRQLSQALMAAILAAGLQMAFFDGLSFPMAAGLLFMVAGLAGAASRLLTSPPRGFDQVRLTRYT
jgi:O-antigen ligase